MGDFVGFLWIFLRIFSGLRIFLLLLFANNGFLHSDVVLVSLLVLQSTVINNNRCGDGMMS